MPFRTLPTRAGADILARSRRRPTVELDPSRRSHDASMAYIPYVPRDEAQGLLAELFARYGGARGSVDNIVRIHSLNPPSMEGHVRYYAHIMRGPSPLTRAQREMIAVTVSAANDCFY